MTLCHGDSDGMISCNGMIVKCDDMISCNCGTVERGRDTLSLLRSGGYASAARGQL